MHILKRAGQRLEQSIPLLTPLLQLLQTPKANRDHVHHWLCNLCPHFTYFLSKVSFAPDSSIQNKKAGRELPGLAEAITLCTAES